MSSVGTFGGAGASPSPQPPPGTTQRKRKVPKTLHRCTHIGDVAYLVKRLQKLDTVDPKRQPANYTTPSPSVPLPCFLSLFHHPGQTAPLLATVLCSDLASVIDLYRLPLFEVRRIITAIAHLENISLIVESAASIAAVNEALLLAGHPPLLKDDIPSVFSLQVAHEMIDGTFAPSFEQTAALCGVPVNTAPFPQPPSVTPVSNSFSNVLSFSQPVSPDSLSEAMVQHMAQRAFDMRPILAALLKRLSDAAHEEWERLSIQSATFIFQAAPRPPVSTDVGGGGSRSRSLPCPDGVLHFDTRSMRPVSACLLQAGCAVDTRLTTQGAEEELDSLLELLPHMWRDRLNNAGKEVRDTLVDVVLDVGRAPVAYCRRSGRFELSEGRGDLVSEEVVDGVLGEVGEPDDDGRVGVTGTLHRVAVLFSRGGRAAGLTMRVGRHLYGVAGILTDVLLSERYFGKSVLVMGPPGCGKTTMARDVARVLAERVRVIVVDTSDEIGGADVKGHASIGDARRMSVADGKRRMGAAMIEAVENHTPDVLIVDELSERTEVMGAATARHRGVRMFASAHGDLRGLVRNVALRPLVGGVERVTMGDASCNGKAGGKVRLVRGGDAVFEVVVEMGVVGGEVSALRVVHDVNVAVDAILSGEGYECEMRWRAARSGALLSRRMTA